MRRLSVRLIASHVAVAAIAGVATFVIVQLLAPALFDASWRRAEMQGGGPGAGRGQMGGLRLAIAGDVTAALVVGAIVGVTVAALFGAFAAFRLVRPLNQVREATRRIAGGGYGVQVPDAGTAELDGLAADVRTLAAALDDTERRRTRLLGEVAHEMRTPLTVIDGTVEGMIDGIWPADAEHLGRLGDESRRLRRLSDDLSLLSRTEEGRLAIAPVRCDLARVVADAAERLRPQVADAGLTLQVDAAGVVPVVADPDRVAQIVTNLVGNAIRATGPGGAITLRVARSAAGDDGMTEVTVADTGEGLAAADLERVFERFYRVPDRRSPGSDTGSGIGLTLARRLARDHGGELVARSEGRGRGATFVLTLPAAPAAS